MIKEKSWKEFKDSGLLWWTNMILNTFGWSICFDVENDEVVKVYPVRTKHRGFDNRINEQGYINISKYMKDNADELLKESME